jgi:hypothetical protein
MSHVVFAVVEKKRQPDTSLVDWEIVCLLGVFSVPMLHHHDIEA